MQTVRASCPTCGDVTLLPERFTVTENRAHPGMSTYTFTCPGCAGVITKPAPLDVLGLFAAAKGVRWNVIHHAPELDERHDGPPLTYSDLLDFRIDLYGASNDALCAFLEGK